MIQIEAFRAKSGTPYAVVFYDEEHALISDSWLGKFHSDEEFKRVLAFIVGEIERRGAKLWLADLRHLNRSLLDFQDWLAEEISPRAFEAGLEREAVVLPLRETFDTTPDEFDVVGSASGAIDRIADDRVRFFFGREEARTWLLRGEIDRS
jgi:hypothetical protein